uniref:Uncharacterized protein n=1 Tax=Manihot esculenta TaxID=3983 RepID=A0A2C9ULA5_MANES
MVKRSSMLQRAKFSWVCMHYPIRKHWFSSLIVLCTMQGKTKTLGKMHNRVPVF